MQVDLISITPDSITLIEKAGRTCYDSEKENPEIIKRFIDSKHTSTIEHGSASFRVKGVSRALMAQLTRHRIASYSIRSQRYVDENNFEYVMPNSICQEPEAHRIYTDCMETIRTAYKELRGLNIPKEDSRYVLPNSCTVELVVTMNFRSWRNFFELRCDKTAQWEIRYMANSMLQILNDHNTYVFGDLAEQFLK